MVGWSTERMVEKESEHAFKDAEEMVQWRSIDQEGMNKMWKTVSEQIEEEVRETSKVEVSKRGAYKGSEPSEWVMVQRVKKINFGNGVEIAGRESFRGSGNTSNGMQESRTEKGGDEAAATDEDHGRCDWTD